MLQSSVIHMFVIVLFLDPAFAEQIYVDPEEEEVYMQRISINYCVFVYVGKEKFVRAFKE